MRHSLADGMHVRDDQAHLHLREDDPKYKKKKKTNRRKDDLLNPQAIHPPIQPVLYRSFDWIAANPKQNAFKAVDFDAGTFKTSPPPIRKVVMSPLAMEFLSVGTRYFCEC